MTVETSCRGVKRTAWSRVKCHGIVGLLVDTLENVDLAVVGPAWADHPKGGPGTATDRLE